MSTLFFSFVQDPLFKVFAAILGPKGNTPIGRFVAAAALGSLAVHAVKPAHAYELGQVRPWSVLSDDLEPAVEPTLFPWWSGPVLFAFFSALFV